MTTTSAPASRSAARADLARGAVRAVDDDAQPVEAVRRSCRAGAATYWSPASGEPRGRGRRRAPSGRSQASPRRRSIGVLDLVGELVPAAGEELDPVVGHRVVRGGEHDAEVGAGWPRPGRRPPGVGSTPTSSTSTPALARPAATAAARNSPGRPRVTADDRPRPVALELRRARRARAPRRPPGPSASSAVRSRLASPRTPSVPNSRPTVRLLSLARRLRASARPARPPSGRRARQTTRRWPRGAVETARGAVGREARRISACCTAAPCGPS